MAANLDFLRLAGKFFGHHPQLLTFRLGQFGRSLGKENPSGRQYIRARFGRAGARAKITGRSSRETRTARGSFDSWQSSGAAGARRTRSAYPAVGQRVLRPETLIQRLQDSLHTLLDFGEAFCVGGDSAVAGRPRLWHSCLFPAVVAQLRPLARRFVTGLLYSAAAGGGVKNDEETQQQTHHVCIRDHVLWRVAFRRLMLVCWNHACPMLAGLGCGLCPSPSSY